MSGKPLIDDSLVARFRADLDQLTQPAPTPEQPLGVAVSGGSDSLALLLLAQAACPGAVVAATVDHQLRPEAAAEAQHVAHLCASLGVSHATLRLGPMLGLRAIANIQERARTIRYRCLQGWAADRGVAHVATAHQRDDLAETFLMRAGRGAGLRGLAAMRGSRTLAYSTVSLVRPLLGWTRAELATIVASAGLDAFADPSNIDPRYDRARIRLMLADGTDLPPAGLARAATNLRDVEEAIEWMVLREVSQRLEQDDAVAWVQPTGLPFELKRRLVIRAIEGVREQAGMLDLWRTTAVAALVRSLEAGGVGMVADVQARAVRGRWRFRLAPPRRATGPK